MPVRPYSGSLYLSPILEVPNMNPTVSILAVSLALGLLAGAAEAAGPPSATAQLVNGTGAAIGSVVLTEGTGGVLIEVEATGLTPGWHGVHLHEMGVCAADGFKSAGAHMGHHEGVGHGLLNPNGPEAGDLPNLYSADGSAHVQLFSDKVTLDPAKAGPGRLLIKDGSLIIHAARDDQSTQPIGGAGARVACGVLKVN